MNTKEQIQEALKVYLSHCCTQIARKRTLNDKRPSREQLKRIEEIRSVWRAKFDSAYSLIVKIEKGELIGL